MNEESLEEYVGRSREIIDDSPQMDEANTKKRLVEPFIEDVLEWDGFSDIELEYSVQMGRNPKKVDYALILEDTPVVFVEAKGLDEGLSEDEEKQLRSYMRQVGVDWGVLTNGERFKFLKREKNTNRPSEITFGDLNLGGLLSNEEVIRTVSKKSVKSGESERIADEIQRRREAVSRLRERKDKISDDIVGVVTDIVDESVASVAETEAKEFVDRVVDELENGGTEIPEEGGSGDDETPIDMKDDIVLTEDGTEVTAFSAETQADTMAEAVEYLIEKHGLLDEISLPYVPGGKIAMLNDEPVNPDGTEMRGYRETEDGYCVYTSLNKSSKETQVERFAQECGLGVKFNW